MTSGTQKSGRKWGLAILLLVFCQPLYAQHVVTMLPHIDPNGENPITFMRTHYVLQPTGSTDTTLPTPPSSAFKPAQVRHAYGFDKLTNQGQGQVIGIVDAYDDANIESDLGVFSAQFGLPACTSSNGCFRKVYSNGRKPAANSNWAIETSLDVEWAHAIAPKATIVLVEAPSNSLGDLLAGVQAAERNGASVVSMSWTVGEFSSETSLDNYFASNSVSFRRRFRRRRDRRRVSGRVSLCYWSGRDFVGARRKRELSERDGVERERRRNRARWSTSRSIRRNSGFRTIRAGAAALRTFRTMRIRARGTRSTIPWESAE